MSLVLRNGALLLRNGSLAASTNCCCGGGGPCGCDLEAIHTAGKVVMASVTVTLPDIEGDCPAGSHSAQFELPFDPILRFFFGFANVNIGEQCFPSSDENNNETEVCIPITVKLIALLQCSGVEAAPFMSYPIFSSINSCNIMGGGFNGFSPDEGSMLLHGSQTLNGVCVPVSSSKTFVTEDGNYSLEWTVWAQ